MALVTDTNKWATALTKAEAWELYDRVERGALRALDVAFDARDGDGYHPLRDTARDLAAVQANLNTVHDLFAW